VKNALILHGTGANPHANWFDWLREQLEANGYVVWVPSLPDADHPDMKKYRDYIFSEPWEFGPESVIIGHSSGAVAALSLLEALPTNTQISTAVMVGVYRPEEKTYSTTDPVDIEKVRAKAKRFLFVHSDDDPYCPLQHAEYFAKELQGELVVLPGNQHFSDEQDPKHKKLLELIELLGLQENIS
jgi:predicted alpha/beta hydrolase family esterase